MVIGEDSLRDAFGYVALIGLGIAILSGALWIADELWDIDLPDWIPLGVPFGGGVFLIAGVVWLALG